MFLVTRSGTFGGRRWKRGQVLICRGTPRSGDIVVLVARGQGRPRLGRVQGTRFLGSAGEPCHPARWQVAGRLASVDRSLAPGCLVALDGRPAPVRRERPPTQQLSLFAA